MFRCLLLTLCLPWLIVDGCVPIPHPPPVANAGADQTVPLGDAVRLDGSGSEDPGGDPLTYEWRQIAGLTVALMGAKTAMPTFTAPRTEADLSFELTVRNRHGGSDTDSVTVLVRQVAPSSARLFVVNRDGNSVTSYLQPGLAEGDVAPATRIAGAATRLSSPRAAVVNSAGALIAANFATSTLTGYDSALDATGNLAPSLLVQGPATLLETPTAMAFDAGGDVLYLAETGLINRIAAYADVSKPGFNGNVAPVRAITSGSMLSPFGIFLDSNDNLYVGNNSYNNVVVFARVSTLDDYVPANRTLNSADFGSVYGVFVDSSDRLLVVNSAAGGNRVVVFRNASTLNGWIDADLTLTVPGAVSLTAIGIDAAGTGYLLDSGANAILVYERIATRSGSVPPDRRIQGPNTRLSGPAGLFLVE